VWDPDSFRKKNPDELRQMVVHGREWFYGEPIGKVAKKLYAEGYFFDYISRRMLAQGLGEKYAEVIDPALVSKPLKALRSPFDPKSGLSATRWKRNGHTMYFVVNQGVNPVRIEHDSPEPEEGFVIMNPLDGSIRRRQRRVDIEPGHSLFVSAAANIPTSVLTNAVERSLEIEIGEWKVEPVCGGPVMPEARKLSSLESWHKWDESFSGTMRYTAKFDVDEHRRGELKRGRTIIYVDLGEVCEIARVKLNGRDLGVRFMPPYKYLSYIAHLKATDNVLEVEVTNLGANRLRWNDMTGVKWKIFNDINMVGSNYLPLDAAKYRVRPSGLIGPVTLKYMR
jgi:hypothetical protein